MDFNLLLMGALLIVLGAIWWISGKPKQPSPANDPEASMHLQIARLIESTNNPQVKEHLRAAGKALYDAEL